ncbi:MAG: hypothetical protein HY360_09180 [Verrucomicrobia bacterium]|nr:hypothetical protein [Verrucomicrobiota bacterium]
MNPNWAEENLQVIRTLMERSAVYRHALAPIMLMAGSIGIGSAVVSASVDFSSSASFVGYWMCVAIVVVGLAFLQVRRQALKDHEALWSIPTRRVVEALTPCFSTGMFLGALFIYYDQWLLTVLTLSWVMIYGCAIHTAGFFMQRGIKWLGWFFVFGGAAFSSFFVLTGFLNLPLTLQMEIDDLFPHFVMGFFFGGLHLAYGVYLYFTEQKTNET